MAQSLDIADLALRLWGRFCDHVDVPAELRAGPTTGDRQQAMATNAWVYEHVGGAASNVVESVCPAVDGYETEAGIVHAADLIRGAGCEDPAVVAVADGADWATAFGVPPRAPDAEDQLLPRDCMWLLWLRFCETFDAPEELADEAELLDSYHCSVGWVEELVPTDLRQEGRELLAVATQVLEGYGQAGDVEGAARLLIALGIRDLAITLMADGMPWREALRVAHLIES